MELTKTIIEKSFEKCVRNVNKSFDFCENKFPMLDKTVNNRKFIPNDHALLFF